MPRRRIPRWVGWPLLALWTYLVLAFFAQMAIFHPAKHPEGLWEFKDQFGAADVWLDTSDGVRIHGWMIEDAAARFVTLYLHGNAGNLTHRVDHIQAIRQAGSALMIIDYRGYGRSEGSPSEEGIYRDSEAAYDWLIAKGYGADRIVVYGESLGTAAAADLASRRDCAGVILEAPFPSAKAVAHTVLPWLGPLVVSGFDTARKIAKVRAPVWILHGDRDQVIAYEFGREVFAAANEPKEFWRVEGALHSNIVQVAGRRYVEKLRDFYGGLPRRRRGS